MSCTTAASSLTSSSNISENAKIIKSLNQLIEHVKNDKTCNEDPTHLSHYRDIPDTLQKAYELLDNGATMVHSTATKYTLVGKIDIEQQTKLGRDLLRGCEFIGASLHMLLQDGTGCSRATRHYTQRSCCAIFIAVQQLVVSFVDSTAFHQNIGAQKTGAIWEACDDIIKKMIPRGNRNAIRRELFTWIRECQDTMEEFQDMIDLGPQEGSTNVEEEQDDDDAFGEEKYTDEELPIAQACLGILKNSRGNMKIALETCEALGARFRETQDEKYLDSIQKMHQYARRVGEGVTDLGSLMYPPLNNLEDQVKKQSGFIKELLDFVLGLQDLSANIPELANTLKKAIDTREAEFYSALEYFRSNQ